MERKLYRITGSKMIAGVCSGLADHFNIDVILVRIAFGVSVLFGFLGAIIYIILWAALPTRPI